MKSALLCASVALVLSISGASQVPDNQVHFTMAGAMTVDNGPTLAHSMADMLAQAQGSGDMKEKVLFNTVQKPPQKLLELVSIVKAKLSKYKLLRSEPADLPVQGYDGHDHKAVDVKEVAHKDMESITGDWSHEYGPNMGKWHPDAEGFNGKAGSSSHMDKDGGGKDSGKDKEKLPGMDFKGASGPSVSLGLTAATLAVAAFLSQA